MISIKIILEFAIAIASLVLASKAQTLSNISVKLQQGMQIIAAGFWMFFMLMSLELADSLFTGAIKQALDVSSSSAGIIAFVLLVIGFSKTASLAKRKK